MAGTPVTTSLAGRQEEDEEMRKPHPQPHGYVMIVVPNDDGHEPLLLASSSPPTPPHDHVDAPEEEEEERSARATSSSSLWRASAVLALAALLAVAAGYVCLYADVEDNDAGAVAWRLLEAREEDGGDDRRSFLLPLYPKPRRGGASACGGDWPQNSTSLFPPLAGNGANLFPEGMYYTTVSLGNPPRPYFLDVDTGSRTTWIQCDAPCTSCAKGAGTRSLYRPAQTNLVAASDPLCERVQHDNPNQCDYDISYADGSSSLGVHVRDNLQFISEDGESRENTEILFGCGYHQQGTLLNRLENTDGIFGLSNQALSLPTQLASRGIISNAFGHCMTRDPSDGGYLFLGDDYIPRWGMTWVPIRDGPADDVRRALVHQVNHGDQQLNVQGKLTQVTFDIGSTYTYFPNEALTKLVSSLKSASPLFVQDDSDNTLPFCMKADFLVRSVDDVKHFFKPLSLQFEKQFFFSRTFNIHPEDYLIISDKGNVCLGVLDGTTIGYDSVIVVGDVSLRGKLIAYDNDENKVGWIDSDCTNPRKQSRIPSFLRRALHNQLL